MLDNLPAIDIAGETAGIALHRRRRTVEDPARHPHHLPSLSLVDGNSEIDVAPIELGWT